MGTCSSVGLTGLKLNGGQGPRTRWSGVTSGHLYYVELIDRTGRSIVANASNEYSDLLWLARGGGSVGYHYPCIITGLKFGNLVSYPFDRKRHCVRRRERERYLRVRYCS